jgi:thiol-disulfide isomerase/thioredoxin
MRRGKAAAPSRGYDSVTSGLIALAVALAVAVAAGLAWQRANGRMRSARTRSGGLRGGGMRGPDAGAPGTGPLMTGAELGEPLGRRATLVQFSTAFCAPCRATRRILAEVAGMTDGVAHVEIDAESHLDLVRRLDIRRTPTVLVLGPDGRITKRASGQPRKADVIAALGNVAQVALPTDQIGKQDSDSEPGRA